MSKNLNDMLNDKNKNKESSGSLLTTLFRQILKDNAVLPTQWYDMCNRYYRSPLSTVKKNTKDIGQARNNLSRVIAMDLISWKTFIRAVSILGPKSIKLTCELDWGNGRVTKSSATMGNDVYNYSRVEEIRAELKAAEEERARGDSESKE